MLATSCKYMCANSQSDIFPHKLWMLGGWGSDELRTKPFEMSEPNLPYITRRMYL